MKVLIVHRGTKKNRRPFITEQVNAVRERGVKTKYFSIVGKGIMAYINSYKSYLNSIQSFKPDIIHAHYGLTGLFANIQRKIPVVTTFHGSDINLNKVLPFSKLAARLSNHNIFVSEKLVHKAKITKRYTVLPCGVDFDTFFPIEKINARQKLGQNTKAVYILFSASFDNPIKNAILAKEALKLIDKDIVLVELNGYSRNQVNLLLNACNLALLTSVSEGSPQFIKEAMACNCPIVSTDVGSIKEIISNTDGCYLATFDKYDVAKKIQFALKFNQKTDGRDNIQSLDNKLIASTILELYKAVLG